MEFEVEGPFKVPFAKRRGGQFIGTTESRKFLKEHESIVQGRGVYVFCIRVAGGLIPAYVGKATTSFAREAFTRDKLHIYNAALMDYERDWPPFMFFIVHPRNRGPVNRRVIEEIEGFLIKTAAQRNPNLKNIRRRRRITEEWSIRGVFNSAQGRPNNSERRFRKVMGW